MKFGIFYEHQLARPWNDGDEHRLLTDALDQVELADKLGFDYVWEVEHHFLEEYSHSSSPEVFLAAASQRTKQIRLGHGIVNVMPEVNHPARVAERAATLDLISGGRLELGTGESSSQAELGGFGVDRERKRAAWSEALGAIARMFVESPFAGHDGAAFKMPPREVLPKPMQKPHPPLWVACSRRDTIITAAENGIGALSFSFVEPEQAKEWVDEYYATIESEKCMPIGFDVNPNFAVVLPMLCHQDEQVAMERALDGANFFGYSLAHYYVFGDHVPGKTDIAAEFMERRGEFGFGKVDPEKLANDSGPLGVKLMQDGLGSLRGAIGTPEQIVGLVERYREAGVDQIIFVSQCGRVQHEHIKESYELFAAEVMPHFRDSEIEAAAVAKKERLAPAIEAALARRAPARTLDREYVITPQGEPDAAQPPKAAHKKQKSKSGGSAKLMKQVAKYQSVVVDKMSDRQLERTIGTKIGVRLLFKSMERMYRPSQAGKFRGEVEFTLSTPHGDEVWTLKCGEGKAKLRPGAASEPALKLRAPVAEFVRIGTGGGDPASALVGGRLRVKGDFEVAAKLGPMFGGKSFF